MKLFCLVLGVVHITIALPALTLNDLEIADDTVSVGSYIRETRAAPPDNYHRSYQNEGDGEIGYSRKKTGGGKKGYQHFDSYHKKAGDNYEFEKQDSFGLDDGGNEGGHEGGHEGHHGAHSHNHEKIAERDNEQYRDPDSEDVEEYPRKPAKKQTHRHHEELREGASDGNGGSEAYGHDAADYVLPEKYTYGNGEEYNF